MENLNREKIISDLSSHINLNKKFLGWMGLLTILLLICLGAYYQQLTQGLQVTGLNDYVSWGIYLSNFVFFVAASLIGMLMSSVLILSGQHWAKPISRIAEVIAVAFSAIAGLVIVSDMGMPQRLHHVILYGRIQSPILWDITVVNAYLLFSLLLFYVPLIPDLHILSGRFSGKLQILNKIFKVGSLGYQGTEKQKKTIARLTRLLSYGILPLAFGIHTVTSWIFASTTRSGWHSTIFGPYFISGAFVAGVAAVVIVMTVVRKTHKLDQYLKDSHYDKLGKLLLVVSMLYIYFNINEYLVPLYGNKKADAHHLHELFAGKHAFMFWFTQIGCLLIPALLMFFKRFRKIKPLFLISIFVIVGAWLKRYLIVIPTQEHPYLPIQNVTEKALNYQITLEEALVSIAPIILVIMIISVLLKFFPVVPIEESLEEVENHAKN